MKRWYLLLALAVLLLPTLARPVQAAPLRAFATFDPLDPSDDVDMGSYTTTNTQIDGVDRYNQLMTSFPTIPGAIYRMTVTTTYWSSAYNHVWWLYTDGTCAATLSTTEDDGYPHGGAAGTNVAFHVAGIHRSGDTAPFFGSDMATQTGATVCVYTLLPSRAQVVTSTVVITRLSVPQYDAGAWLYGVGSSPAAATSGYQPYTVFDGLWNVAVAITGRFDRFGAVKTTISGLGVVASSDLQNWESVTVFNGSATVPRSYLALGLQGDVRWVQVSAAAPVETPTLTAIPTSSAIPAPGECEDYVIRGSGSGSIRDGEVIQTVAGALTISDGSKSATVPAYPSAAVAPFTLGLAGSGSYTFTGNGTLRICPGELATTTATATPDNWERGHCIDIVAGAGYTSFPRNAEIAAYGSWTPASAVIEIVGDDPTDRENSAFTFTSTRNSYSSLVPNFAPTKAFVYGSWVYAYKVRVVSGGTLADVAFTSLKLCAFGTPDVFPTGTPTRTPTATPWPTPPPYPTQIPYPTWSSYATPPPYPTQIPYPTQRPYLTPPPYPTQIPYPTQRPYPTNPPWPSVVVQFPTATATPEGGTAGNLPGPFPTAWMPQPYNPTALPSSGPPALPGLGNAPTWGPLPTWAAVVTSTWALPGQGVVITATMVALFGPVKTLTAWSETTFGPDPWAKGGADAAPIAAEIGGAFGWLGVLSLLEPFAPLLPPLLIIFFVRLVKLIISVVRYVKQLLPVVG